MLPKPRRRKVHFGHSLGYFGDFTGTYGSSVPPGPSTMPSKYYWNAMPAKLTTLCSSMFHCWYRRKVPRACGKAFKNV